MSKLLKEDQIRRFMKLASIGNLSEGFVDTLEEEEVDEGMGMYKRDDEMEEGMGMYKRDGDKEDPMMEEEELDVKMDVADAAPDEMDAPAGDVEDTVMDIVSTIADALEEKYPELKIDVADDEGGEAAEDADDLGGLDDEAEGDEVPMEEAMYEEDSMEEGHGMKHGDDDVMEEIEMVDEEELVSEVLARVTKRLRAKIQENKKSEITTK